MWVNSFLTFTSIKGSLNPTLPLLYTLTGTCSVYIFLREKKEMRFFYVKKNSNDTNMFKWQRHIKTTLYRLGLILKSVRARVGFCWCKLHFLAHNTKKHNRKNKLYNCWQCSCDVEFGRRLQLINSFDIVFDKWKNTNITIRLRCYVHKQSDF